MTTERLVRILKGALYQLGRAGVKRGVPPAWLGYRCVLKETPQEYFARYDKEESLTAGTLETIHPKRAASNPLPRNVDKRENLPADRGWWGYSFRDVPSRISSPTQVLRIPDGCVVSYVNPDKDQFWPAVLNQDTRALQLREMSFRSFHKGVLRSRKPVFRPRATWILERVYRNHSHWLTAHLPKLLLLKQCGLLADLVLPPASMRTRVMNDSMRLLGIDPDDYATFDPARPMRVEQLTVVDTDRFRPELLRPVRDALRPSDKPSGGRKIYISRVNAPRRHVTNADEVWRLLDQAGFDRVIMEDLTFEDQIACMQEARVVVAPHGAGLTNMMFCAPETHIVEIADLSFPNPNFYALASAMGHHYWIISAEGVGEGHPLERDMHVPIASLEKTLTRLPV